MAPLLHTPLPTPPHRRAYVTLLGVPRLVAPLHHPPCGPCATNLPTLPLCVLTQRHGVKLKKLNRPADQRKALLRGLTTELIRHGRIRTLLVRCKAARSPADHMITLAKDGSLHARRQAIGYLYDKDLVHRMFELAPERYVDRKGGYTRVKRDGFRRGDNSEMGVIELV